MTPNAEPYRGFFVHPADSKHLLPLKFNFAPIIPQRGCNVKTFFALGVNYLKSEVFPSD